jgi:hypothetical protein
MRRRYHNDEVYLQRGRHSITLGNSQRHMRIALFMALHHQESLQTWFLLAYDQG